MNYSPDIHDVERIMGADIPVCLTDLELHPAAVSGIWKKMFGADNNFSLNDFFESDISAMFEKVLRGSLMQEAEVKKVYQNDTFQNYKLIVHPYFQGADIRGFYCIAQSIGKKPILHETPDIVCQKFSEVFHHSVIGMAIVSLSGVWTDVNEKLCEMTGYTSGELKLLTFQELTHPEDLEKDLELLRQLVNGEISSYQIEKRYYHKAGHIIWANLGVTMVRDAENSCFVAQIEDITLTKKAQETIRRNESIFSGIFHSSYQFTALLSTDGRIKEMNNAALSFFGLTQKSSIGKLFYDLPNWITAEENVEKLIQNIARAAEGAYHNSEEKLRDNENNEVRIDFTLKPVFDEHRQVVSIVAEGMIIQEIIDARKKVLESEQKLRSFFNLSPVAFVVNDLETRKFVDFNDAFIFNTGYTREEFLELDYWTLFPDEYRRIEPVVMQSLDEKGIYGPIALEYMRRDGVRFPIVINGMLTLDSTGRQQIWSVVQDISQLKQKEQELRKLNEEIDAHNKKLSASNNELEQFAYVASHDLQEPLRMITGFLTLLEQKYKESLDEKARQYIHYAVDGAARLRQIIIGILEYSSIHKDTTEHVPTDMDKVLDNTLQLLSGMISEKQAVITRERLPVVHGQRVALQQLFSNLISNAMKYQPEGNRPEISIRSRELKDSWEFCIEDNGIGIRPEFRDKIFNLFTRLNSKREYEGSGIGLALCKKIAEKHGGTIRVEPASLQGSRFYFTLAK